MTPARLLNAVAKRCVTCRGIPGDDARWMLQRLLTQVVDGGVRLSQRQLAHALGWDERKASRALAELLACGLLATLADPADGRRKAPELDLVAVEAWAKGGELVFSDDVAEGEIAAETACNFGGDSSENCMHPRAGASTSSSSSPSSSPTTPTIASSPEAFEHHAAMVRAVRRALPYGAFNPVCDEEIWHWVGKYSVQHVQDVCRRAGKASGRSFNFIESILVNEEVEAKYGEEKPGNVAEFEKFRGLRPWHHGEAQ